MPVLPPNGPSPSVPVIISLNIELRNTASKSSACARLGADVAPGGAAVGGRAGAGQAERACRRQRAAHAKTADVSQRVARRRHDGRAQRATARSEAERGRHHITSMSAWMAPEALMACRM